jgi:hypothetical protein
MTLDAEKFRPLQRQPDSGTLHEREATSRATAQGLYVQSHEQASRRIGQCLVQEGMNHLDGVGRFNHRSLMKHAQSAPPPRKSVFEKETPGAGPAQNDHIQATQP